MPRGVPKNGVRMTKKRIAEIQANAVEMAADSKFSINERFSFIEDIVGMLVAGKQASVIVAGSGGLGKSYTVTKALEANGLTDMTDLPSFEDGIRYDSSKSYTTIRGFSTTKGLYRILYENKNSTILMDDTDSVMKDPNSLNLLKAALDSYSKRIISYRADIRDEDLPNFFEFKGSVVFLTNTPSKLLDQALTSRSMVVDLSMTAEQKLERMAFILEQNEFMPEVPMNMKIDALKLITKVYQSVKDLSLRTLIQVIRIRETNPHGRWERLAEYTITN